MNVTPTCPNCGGTSIGHVERALVAFRAIAFEIDEHEGLIATEFAPTQDFENLYVDWQTSESVDYP